MNNWKILWRIVGLLLVILSIIGFIAIQNLASKIHPVMPEEMAKLLPAFLGLIYCIIVLISSIVLSIRSSRQTYPSIIKWYVFAFFNSIAALGFGFFAGNDTVWVTVVSLLGIVVFALTCLTILTRDHTETGTPDRKKKIFIGTISAVIIVMLVGFILPQWFDATRNFPDHNLKVVVRERVGKHFGFISRSDLEKISYINASYRHIGSIRGIGACKNLEALDLTGNWVDGVHALTDISPLKDLHHLTRLGLSSGSLEDVTPLSGLIGLTYLDLGLNRLQDITPLESLVNLSYLDLWGNEILDVSPLQGLTNLSELNLHDNKIIDISPLIENAGLGDGDKLILIKNPLSEISTGTYVPELQKRGVLVQLKW
jgi:Leucine-rich repeat (LRR) protein